MDRFIVVESHGSWKIQDTETESFMPIDFDGLVHDWRSFVTEDEDLAVRNAARYSKEWATRY